MPNLTGWHLVIILVIILLLFGAPRLPKLARSLGESMRIFRGEVRTMNDENKDANAKDAETPAADAQCGTVDSTSQPPRSDDTDTTGGSPR
ncbi:Sec-independent protein translocase subunit TatA [Gulosibacter sediminis]|uniref:Sec-independent protein translocase subunit TatA n=1 Tax=Gulosibacter sediminis TaxID=1729695 RepID=UPI0024A8C757|nr:Sec-independent protein translocase subunit TatA [Gulosibacter sediminis]